jgi:hypothetical protein
MRSDNLVQSGANAKLEVRKAGGTQGLLLWRRIAIMNKQDVPD